VPHGALVGGVIAFSAALEGISGGVKFAFNDVEEGVSSLLRQADALLSEERSDVAQFGDGRSHMASSGGAGRLFVVFIRSAHELPSEALPGFLKLLVKVLPSFWLTRLVLMPADEPAVPLPSQPMRLAVSQAPALTPRSGPECLDAARNRRVPIP
jgi:hypothetical protein